MFKQPLAITAAILVPLLTFWMVVSLNDRPLDREKLDQKVVSFDVEKKKQLNKPKPKPKQEKRQRPRPQDMPSLKPSLNNDALALGGLSFGVPQFDESRFDDLADNSLLDDTGAGRKKDQTVDTKPKVVKRSPIVYPELARKQGISGYVTMNVLISETGAVEDVVIVDSKPAEIFDLKADSTIRRWTFEPATFNGRKVEAWALQKIVFKLN